MLGRPAFHDTSLALEVAHLGERWGYESHGDVSVMDLVRSCEGSDAARVEMLMEVLEVEPDWRIYRLSDGQRRRVQLLLGLARRNRVLLLDEVTTDLDVVARQNLLQFLKRESEAEGTTIVYATHIFDGLDAWATDLVYLRGGAIRERGKVEDLGELCELVHQGVPSPLFRLVERWLRAEFDQRKSIRVAAAAAAAAAAGAGAGAAAAAPEVFVERERTMFTGFSRGCVIPTPDLRPVAAAAPCAGTGAGAADSDAAASESVGAGAGGAGGWKKRQASQAEVERHEWAMRNNSTATVTNDEGGDGGHCSLFTADLPRFTAAGAGPGPSPGLDGGGRLGFNKTNPLDRR